MKHLWANRKSCWCVWWCVWCVCLVCRSSFFFERKDCNFVGEGWIRVCESEEIDKRVRKKKKKKGIFFFFFWEDGNEVWSGKGNGGWCWCVWKLKKQRQLQQQHRQQPYSYFHYHGKHQQTKPFARKNLFFSSIIFFFFFFFFSFSFFPNFIPSFSFSSFFVFDPCGSTDRFRFEYYSFYQ